MRASSIAKFPPYLELDPFDNDKGDELFIKKRTCSSRAEISTTSKQGKTKKEPICISSSDKEPQFSDSDDYRM